MISGAVFFYFAQINLIIFVQSYKYINIDVKSQKSIDITSILMYNVIKERESGNPKNRKKRKRYLQ